MTRFSLADIFPVWIGETASINGFDTQWQSIDANPVRDKALEVLTHIDIGWQSNQVASKYDSPFVIRYARRVWRRNAIATFSSTRTKFATSWSKQWYSSTAGQSLANCRKNCHEKEVCSQKNDLKHSDLMEFSWHFSLKYGPYDLPATMIDSLEEYPICDCGKLCPPVNIHFRTCQIVIRTNSLIQTNRATIYADAVYCSDYCRSLYQKWEFLALTWIDIDLGLLN